MIKLPFVLAVVFPLTAFAGSLLKPADRIVFIGDSITLQGGGRPDGWVALIKNGLRAANPSADPKLVALGVSGQGVASWQRIETKSRTESVVLRSNDADVKAELDQPADVVVVMLGMNDVLFPRLDDKPEDYDAWAEQYRTFIRSLRERAKPRIFALATPTMCTEDPHSPKNRALSHLIERIGKLAQEENCIVLPTHETMEWLLGEGRKHRPDFHVTQDSVHPSPGGHLAIAMGMLKGFGETEAASRLFDKQSHRLWDTEKDLLSWRVEHLGGEGMKDRFRIQCLSPKPPASSVTLECPQGWKIVSQNADAGHAEFVVEGVADRLRNEFTLHAGSGTAKVVIPAPWLIGIGNIGRAGWTKGEYSESDKSALPGEDRLRQGFGFDKPVELKSGEPMAWTRYFATMDFGGENSPGAIDLAALRFYQNYDVAIGARWIFSEKERPVALKVSPLGFSSENHVTVWLNGEQVYSARPDADKQPVSAKLKAGWNALVFKTNHYQIQWQFQIDLAGDNLDALRVASSPPES